MENLGKNVHVSRRQVLRHPDHPMITADQPRGEQCKTDSSQECAVRYENSQLFFLLQNTPATKS